MQQSRAKNYVYVIKSRTALAGFAG